jgi:lipopolysaccharide export system protein LptA
LQGKADSLAYFLSDSSIIFYQDPILWNDGSQITADTIQILVNEGTIDRLNAKVNSFIISEDSTSQLQPDQRAHDDRLFCWKVNKKC